MALPTFHIIGKKVIGAGLNYKALLTLSNSPKPQSPVIFLKTPSSYITEGQSIEIPEGFAVNEEVELGVVIGKRGKNIPVSDAMEYVGGYCLTLDMTETQLIDEARSKGLPWALGKGFDTACPVSRFVSREELPDPENVRLWCNVNGRSYQDSNTNDLIFSISELISHVSKFMTLEPCDMILTGSPPGMGPVFAGDVIEAGLGDILTMEFPVKAA